MEPAGAGQITKSRIENLSDLVFGLALSIGSIILVSRTVTAPQDMVANIALFGFSFLIIIWIWSGYTRTMAVLPLEVRGTFILNVVLLFCVAVEPYLFYEMFVPDEPQFLIGFASAVYAFDNGAMMLILAGLAYVLLKEEGKKATHTPRFEPARFRIVMEAEIASGAIFLSSALPFLWVADPFGSLVRFDMWYAVFIVFVLMLTFRSRATRKRVPPGAGSP